MVPVKTGGTRRIYHPLSRCSGIRLHFMLNFETAACIKYDSILAVWGESLPSSAISETANNFHSSPSRFCLTKKQSTKYSSANFQKM